MSAEALARAKGYPYPIPDASYLFEDGIARPWQHEETDAWLAGRRPILAVGSNQSPDQLTRKFSDKQWGPIPVTRARLHGYDVVYAAHISTYGSIPATLFKAPETTVTLFITWLSPEQEVRMHATEGNYAFGRLRGVRLEIETGTALDHVHLYAGQRGALRGPAGTPVPLAEVPADNRAWQAMTQVEVQDYVRRRVAADHDLDRFILTSVDDHDLRLARAEQLGADSHPFDAEDFIEIEV